MVSVRSALVVLVLLFASVARADSDGVPFIEGSWSGKIKASYWDQTSQGSNHPKQRYKDKVDVTIDQGAGDFEMDIDFQDGLPTTNDTVLTSAVLEGFVGNGHLSVTRNLVSPLLVGSGTVTRNGKRIKIRGVAATSDFTMEFQILLKKTGD